MQLPWWRAVIAACGLLFTFAAVGADADAPELTLADAVRQALANRPELAAFAFRLREQEAAAAQAALRPAPELEFMLEDVLGTDGHSGFQAANATLQLSQVIELGDKRGGRLAVAEARSQSTGTARAAQQLDVVGDVARHFIEVVRGQSRLALAEEGLRLAEQTQVDVEQRVAAARVPLAEGARASAAVVEAWIALDDTVHELNIARRHLAAAMGEPEVRFGEASGDLSTLPEVAPLQELLARLEQSPDLLQFADEARVREAETRLAQLQQRANLRATLGVRRLEQSNDFALVAGISLPLFQARRAAPEVAASRARLAQVATDREAAYLRLQSGLYAQHQELGHSRELAAKLGQELIPALESALQLTTEAYERGRYSYQELLAAQRELLGARARLLETVADYQLLRIEIERLSGSSLDAIGENP